MLRWKKSVYIIHFIITRKKKKLKNQKARDKFFDPVISMYQSDPYPKLTKFACIISHQVNQVEKLSVQMIKKKKKKENTESSSRIRDHQV